MAPKQAEKVSVSELNSFITKFKSLCSAGFNASLQINSKDGCATVSLSVEVGYLPSVTPAGKPKKQKRSPAYYRRQERRKEAKKISATAVEAVRKVDYSVSDEKVDADVVVIEAGKNVSEAISVDTEAVSVDTEAVIKGSNVESDNSAGNIVSEAEISQQDLRSRKKFKQ